MRKENVFIEVVVVMNEADKKQRGHASVWSCPQLASFPDSPPLTFWGSRNARCLLLMIILTIAILKLSIPVSCCCLTYRLATLAAASSNENTLSMKTTPLVTPWAGEVQLTLLPRLLHTRLDELMLSFPVVQLSHSVATVFHIHRRKR